MLVWLYTSDLLKTILLQLYDTLHLYMYCYTKRGKNVRLPSLCLCWLCLPRLPLFTGMKNCSDHVAKALLINNDKLPEIIKTYKINKDSYDNGYHTMLNKEEMRRSFTAEVDKMSSVLPSRIFFLFPSCPLNSSSLFVVFPPILSSHGSVIHTF